jgi:hypothetical protein
MRPNAVIWLLIVLVTLPVPARASSYFVLPGRDDLVLIGLLKGAKSSVVVDCRVVSDKGIWRALKAAEKRGVKVSIRLSQMPPKSLLAFYRPKVILSNSSRGLKGAQVDFDGQVRWLGSASLMPGKFGRESYLVGMRAKK